VFAAGKRYRVEFVFQAYLQSTGRR